MLWMAVLEIHLDACHDRSRKREAAVVGTARHRAAAAAVLVIILAQIGRIAFVFGDGKHVVCRYIYTCVAQARFLNEAAGQGI